MRVIVVGTGIVDDLIGLLGRRGVTLRAKTKVATIDLERTAVRLVDGNDVAADAVIAGTLGRGRVAYASGCSGQMFKFGAVMGEQLAAAVTGNLSGPALAAWARGDMPAMAV